MTRALYPFAALVGLDTLKLALQLAALEHRLSVLIRGDKGAGKSTAARGLVDLLDARAPFMTLPIGATEDRLLGGLDLEKTIAGQPSLKPGLLAQAHGGVLYVDEVNLLADHLADALLDAAASGTHTVEREGFSVTQAADFVMVGSMNPEEGALRPQLLDRFALVVDVEAPMDPGVRGDVLERRLAYDADPQSFACAWQDEQRALADRMTAARTQLPDVIVTRELLHHIAARVAEQGVRSLRADLAVVRASRACAALAGAASVTDTHVETVLPLALAHRMHDRPRPSRAQPPTPQEPPRDPPQPPSSPKASESQTSPESRESRQSQEGETQRDATDDSTGDAREGAGAERTFVPAAMRAPRIVIDRPLDRSRIGMGTAQGSHDAATGAAIASRPAVAPRELDARASVVHAFARSGASRIATDDLHERVRLPRTATRYILVIDSSGSHAIQERMRLVKGAVAGLLDESRGRHDEVALVACRGAAATILLAPTSSRADAALRLEYLPTGGRTPLAHALELAASLVTDAAVVVLVTDGHANVPSRTDDAWADALTAASALGCPALVIDTEDARQATGRPKQLAEAMRGTHLRLGDLDQAAVIRLIGGAS